MRNCAVKEFFTFPDIIMMGCLSLVGCVITLLHVGAWKIWVSLLVGMTSYVVSEYTTHRFLFHMRPPKSPLMLRFLKRIHYDHHVDPSDLHLLFLPIWYSVPNIILAFTIFYLITRSALNTIAFATGISVFLLYYEWTHYIAHRPIQPVTPWGRKMKRNHLWHHFKNENYWYGVTNPTMDLLFGTYKNEREVPRSQTAKELEHRFPEESTHM
jgi:4-hydroxysphinganine ceramide fatty acyl 2-hydroxylase